MIGFTKNRPVRHQVPPGAGSGGWRGMNELKNPTRPADTLPIFAENGEGWGGAA